MTIARLSAWVLLLAVVGACDAGAPSAAAPDRHHLVVISLDTLRADHLGCYGYARDTSPRIDALAGESLLFERVMAPSSSTAPSHMTMFTGVLPRVHGISNRDPGRLGPGVPYLAELLQEAGWRTAAFADGGILSADYGFDQGFERFTSRLQPFDAKLDEVDAWLAGAPDEPTFLFVHTYGVHSPYLPAPEHDVFTDPSYTGPLRSRARMLRWRRGETDLEDLTALQQAFWADKGLDDADLRYLVGLYDGCIREVDTGVARLLDALDRKGWLDDAWVVVTSDHGEAFKEHGTLKHRQVYEEELHVPLLLRPPGGLPAGQRVAALRSHLDLAPTLLHVLGLPTPHAMQGRSLLPLDSRGSSPAFATGGEGLNFEVHREGDRKVIERGGRLHEAYDLAVDPGERHDLLGDVAPDWALAGKTALDAIRVENARLRERLGEPRSVTEESLGDEHLETLRALGYVR